MEYDPAVSTHKASSITSTTSTSSSSTWDHPISTPSYIHSHNIKPEDQIRPFEEYSFDASLVADRISIPSYDYAEESNNFYFHEKKRSFSNLMDSFISTTNDTDNIDTNSGSVNKKTTKMRKENHEKITDSHHQKDQLNNDMTHDRGSNNNAITYRSSSTSTLTLPSYGQQQPTPIYLQHGDQITVPAISMIHNNRKRSSSTSSDSYASQQPRPIRPYNSSTTTTKTQNKPQQQRSDSPSSQGIGKRSKLNRDLLTDDEKRINHIASEQKRRNTIRTGFKEMTDIIPTLKNINNSKSTILFKAVEYIKHLDKRNRGLREKIASLQVRMKVEGRLAEHQAKYYRSTAANSDRYNKVFGVKQQQQRTYPHHHLYQSQSDSTASPSSTAVDNFSNLPAHTVSALLAHKNQQRQLEELQEQLRMQQQLLAKHNIITPQTQQDITLVKTTTDDDTNSTASYQRQSPLLNSDRIIIKTEPQQRQQRHHYHSISIPSSRSSNSEENDHNYHSTASFIVPQDLTEQQQQQPVHRTTTTKRPWHHHSNDDN